MGNQYGVLTEGTVLNYRYFIFEADRFQHCYFHEQYIAFDRVSQKKVRIAEYFCHENAVRQPDDTVVPVDARSFQQGLQWFRKHVRYAAMMPAGMPKLLDRFQANGTEYAVLEWRDSEWDLVEFMSEFPMEFEKIKSIESALSFLSGAMEELSRLHSCGFVFRWLNVNTIHMDPETKRTYLSCFGNVGLYPDTNEDPLEDNFSEPRRRFQYGCEPGECFTRKKAFGPYSAVYTLCSLLCMLVTNTVVPAIPERVSDGWSVPTGFFTEPVRRVLNKGLSLRAEDRYQSVEELRWALLCAMRER